jgi:ElaA protein
MTDHTATEWQICRFDELLPGQLYELLKLRVDVFVVEQACAYPEIDGKDMLADTRHLTGRVKDGSLVAYARILAPGVRFADLSFGRVAVAPRYRKNGLGHLLVKQVLSAAAGIWPGRGITISAQTYLTEFYRFHGFIPVSDPYLEDDIPHIDMAWNQA